MNLKSETSHNLDVIMLSIFVGSTFTLRPTQADLVVVRLPLYLFGFVNKSNTGDFQSIKDAMKILKSVWPKDKQDSDDEDEGDAPDESIDESADSNRKKRAMKALKRRKGR